MTYQVTLEPKKGFCTAQYNIDATDKGRAIAVAKDIARQEYPGVTFKAKAREIKQ